MGRTKQRRNRCLVYIREVGMVFVVDLDDTICDTDGYSEKYICEFIATHKLPYKQVATNVRFAESKFDWDTETALKWYKEFGDQMMAEFPCKKNAVKFLQSIHKARQKIVIATARATDWHTQPKEVTLKWLADNKIPYDKIYIGRIDKEKICEEVSADFFIDDDLTVVSKVANYFASIGGNKQAFLSTTNYNKDLSVPSGVIRVKDFDDLAKRIDSKQICLE